MGPEKIRNDKVDRKWQNNAYEKGICGRRVLIEPYWNVKQKTDSVYISRKNRINRTILECKGRGEHYVRGHYSRINRTILECKVYSEIVSENKALVLIEPYWNVKLNSKSRI